MKYLKYLGVLLIGLFFINNVNAYVIPTEDVTISDDWDGTLLFDTNKVVKISNITHTNEGTTYGAAIKITGNATVDLVFEGTNILAANSAVVGAGIEVAEGSSVRIYGLDGSYLKVTGGKNSAGIGGIGYESANSLNPTAGNINIYSGEIEVYGGEKGAGIGSGFHSSASAINIYGGNIKAIGRANGAGIGSGFGTSGGTGSYSKVGFYNGGNIYITDEAVVRAAAYDIDFDSIDLYNLDTLYSANYANTYAAGIGGGYGSSSGNIVIDGNADVIAVGSCGGAGIGSGRGTSKDVNYDEDNFDVNIVIKSNSKVVALTTDDKRTTVLGDEGGAGIGLGRGTTIEGTPKGTVEILDNASVYAVGSYNVQAIGASTVVGKYTTDSEGVTTKPPVGRLANLVIDETATVVAINDGFADPIDYDKVSGFVKLDFGSSFFEDNSFIDKSKLPLVITATDDYNNIGFAIQNIDKTSVMYKIGMSTEYKLLLNDYYTADKKEIYLGNEISLDNTNFTPGMYEGFVLTSDLSADVDVDTEYGTLSFLFGAAAGIFEYGSQFHVEAVKDNKTINSLKADLDNKDGVENMLAFDVGVANPSNTEYKKLNNPVYVYIEIPEGWDPNKIMAYYITNKTDEIIDFKITIINGRVFARLEIKHFSTYALVQYKDPYQVTNPNTSDNIMTYIALLIISLMSLVGIKVLKENI